MKHLTIKLKKKGWSDKEIKKTEKIIEKHSKEKIVLDFIKKTSSIIYWCALLILIIANLLISIELIPVFLIIHGYFVYIVIMLIGLIFGILFNFIIINLGYLERKHHVTAAILIPVIAIINMYTIVEFTNKLSGLMLLNVVHRPFFVSVVYVLAFMLPYILSNFHRFRK